MQNVYEQKPSQVLFIYAFEQFDFSVASLRTHQIYVRCHKDIKDELTDEKFDP